MPNTDSKSTAKNLTVHQDFKLFVESTFFEATTKENEYLKVKVRTVLR